MLPKSPKGNLFIVDTHAWCPAYPVGAGARLLALSEVSTLNAVRLKTEQQAH